MRFLHRLLVLFVFVLLLVPASRAAAQSPIVPGSQIAFELDPGRMRSGSTTVPRADANLAFEIRVDGGAPIAAVKATACVATTPSPMLTCRLVPPSMAEGSHSLEVRALATPTEAGVDPSAYSSP